MDVERRSPDGGIYQLKVALRRLSPLIWRRLLVPDSTSLAQLHHIIQIAMGWSDEHAHRFVIYAKDYGIRYPGGLAFEDDPWDVYLTDFKLRVGERFRYEYDFRSSWVHDVRVGTILTPHPKRDYPVCVGGKRACPPEGCGGPGCYSQLLFMWSGTSEPEPILREWMGGDFEAEAFERDCVNERLRHLPNRTEKPSGRSHTSEVHHALYDPTARCHRRRKPQSG